MKIAIDLRQINIEESGGIVQLHKTLFDELFKLYPNENYYIFSTIFNSSFLRLKNNNSFFKYIVLPIESYQTDLDASLARYKIDILYRTYPSDDKLNFSMSKQVILIPDNQQDIYPEFFAKSVLLSRKKTFDLALKKAGAIATISNFSRNELFKRKGTLVKDIFLVYPSIQKELLMEIKINDLTANEISLLPKNKYFIYSANLWKHKNHLNLASAFRIFTSKYKSNTFELILTGNPKGWSKVSQHFKGLPVRHLGYIRPEFMNFLLKNAEALTFFSLYEGFGIPLIEAFHLNTPVLCGNRTSMPEIAGNAALKCSPENPVKMAALMELITKDSHLRKQLIEQGKHQLTEFSSRKSAMNLMNAFKRVYKKNNSLNKLPNKLPLVTIITPSFNQGRFIKRTIDSVLRQDYPHIQYLVIDGGSSDSTTKILKSYKKKFYWVSEKDRGQTDAINKGLSLAKGEIIGYLNSDDILLPGAIIKVVDFFKKNSDCGMVYGLADYINEEDKFIGKYKTKNFSYHELKKDCFVCQPAAFWTKDVVKKIGFFNQKLHYVMDYDYWIRIAKAGFYIHHLNYKLACSRLYAETKTMSARYKIYNEIFAISKKHFGYASKNFYIGYSHHLIHESNSPMSIFKKIPYFYFLYGYFLYLLNIFRIQPGRVSYFLKRYILARLLQTVQTPKFFLNKIKFFGMNYFPFKKSVEGFSYGNTLLNNVTIMPKKYNEHGEIYLEGKSTANGSLRIYADKKEILAGGIKKNQLIRIALKYNEINNKKIEFIFSNYLLDKSKNKIAFILHSTNLFSAAEVNYASL